MEDKLRQMIDRLNTDRGEKLLLMKPAAQWMLEASRTPDPKLLFSTFWREGELAILFADTNVGKSILAVQIADAISRGQGDELCRVAVPAQKVLYMDFELSAKQFQKRYCNEAGRMYNFSDNFIRVELNRHMKLLTDFDGALWAGIERAITESGARVLIVDNLTALKLQSTEAAKEAIPLMNNLLQLKHKLGLSILVVAHTPKRNRSNPITENDLAGSKLISNLADTLFAIGHSAMGSDMRYLIHVKDRSGNKQFGYDNVISCRVVKTDAQLCFMPQGYGPEKDHLSPPETGDSRAQLDSDIVDLYNSNPNLSNREIARQLNTNPMKVTRVLQREKLLD
ncbi:MAG: AAA family ATPase [Chitinophagales bacterium]